MKNLLLLFTFCLFNIFLFGQGSSCMYATKITADGNYVGDLTGTTTHYWYINPSVDGTIDLSISSASSCGIVVDIQEFSSLQTGNNCVPIGPGADGRIVSNWNACGGSSTGSSIILNVIANQFYYLKVSRFALSSGEPYTIGFSGPSLPINLVEQGVRLKNKTAILEWTTTEESNHSHFNIERSANGRSFEWIGKVNNHLSSHNLSKYQFEDNNPLKENYYRIVQYDVNGHFEIFPVLFLNIKKDQDNLQAYFQSNELFLSYETEIATIVPFYLVNAMGQVVYRQQISLEEGRNQLVINQLEALPVGVYFGVLESKNGLSQTPLFKAK